jgi:hypothetical protein
MMAKDTITVQFRLQAAFETIQTIRHALADETAQTELVSLMRETITTYLGRQTEADFDLSVSLRASPVCQIHQGPRLPTPKVQNGMLSWYDNDADLTNRVGEIGSADYLDYLEQEWTKSFRYESQFGAFTAIKEKRRGRLVWYAHRRQAGQLKRVYLGKSENLTETRLNQAARKLNASETIRLTEP